MADTSYYFHRQNWSIDTTPPGRKVRTPTALLISCVLGFMFVIFMPVVGFALVVEALVKKITGAVPAGVENDELHKEAPVVASKKRTSGCDLW